MSELNLKLVVGFMILQFHLGSAETLGSSGVYSKAAVATDAAQCSTIGVDILKRGGSAVDSAIASLLCVGVVNLHSTGIGGGGFMIMYLAASEKTYALDYRETAPDAATFDMYKGNPNGSIYGNWEMSFCIGYCCIWLFFHCTNRWTFCCRSSRTERIGNGLEEVGETRVEGTLPASHRIGKAGLSREPSNQ